MAPLLGAVVTLLWWAAPSAGRAEDLQSWHTVSLRWFQTRDVDLVTVGHFRLTDDTSDFSLWRVGQVVNTHPLPWLDAGVAYRYTESQNAAGAWRHQHRGDFQLTPHWRWGGRVGVSLRQRLELRWNEGVDGVNERLRWRLRFNFATPEWKPVRSVFLSEEIFYDFDRRDVSENRLIPLGVNVRLDRHATVRVFYLLRSINRAGRWDHDHILGSGLLLSL